MSFQFVQKPLQNGSYEPEGIYLDYPLTNDTQEAKLVQTWGAHPDYYQQFVYNGVTLHGYVGLGFEVSWPATVHAVDGGRVSEINIEPGGFERYIKIEHWWGESLYARVDSIQMESGQMIERASPLALTGRTRGEFSQRFHFGIRIRPFNRFDGWGGFSDPLPYLNPAVFGNTLSIPESATANTYPPLPMVNETQNTRRP